MAGTIVGVEKGVLVIHIYIHIYVYIVVYIYLQIHNFNLCLPGL